MATNTDTDLEQFGPEESITSVTPPEWLPGAGGGLPMGGGGIDPTARGTLNLLALLLGAGGLAGIGQNLWGAPPTTTQTPRLSPQQLALLSGAQGQFGQTGNLLQQLTGMIQRPQIPPSLAMLTEQSFQPQFGDLYSQAVNAGRQRGFYDAPATSPPGGAILGPGLANLQGQMAQAKLNLYQNQIGNLLQAMQGSGQLGQQQGSLAANLPTQQRTQTPSPSILQTMGQAAPIVGEIGKILGAANPAGGGGFWSSLSGLSPTNWFS